MQIFITGGTGLVGRALIRALLNKGHDITVLTRNIDKAKKIFGNKIKYCDLLDSLNSFDGYDAVVNLAGEPIGDKRWSKSQKEKLCDSRWGITWHLSNLIKSSLTPPSVLISSSAIGYYGSQEGLLLTESSKPREEFTTILCEKWESLALEAESEKTRVCIIRTGIVFSTEGGALPKMIFPFKYFIGSLLGSGKQYISWIHWEDMVMSIIFLLENKNASGIFNLTAPEPTTNNQFSHLLASFLNRPCWFRLPSWILRLVLGEMGTLLLDGQRAVPEHLLEMGYRFKFDNLHSALKDIIIKHS